MSILSMMTTATAVTASVPMMTTPATAPVPTAAVTAPLPAPVATGLVTTAALAVLLLGIASMPLRGRFATRGAPRMIVVVAPCAFSILRPGSVIAGIATLYRRDSFATNASVMLAGGTPGITAPLPSAAPMMRMILLLFNASPIISLRGAGCSGPSRIAFVPPSSFSVFVGCIIWASGSSISSDRTGYLLSVMTTMIASFPWLSIMMTMITPFPPTMIRHCCVCEWHRLFPGVIPSTIPIIIVAFLL
mmetsp:Transcript_27453/g.57999  ORF Transcript_27453/g.57999 Transcript_27453/m.57999 type:complete len:247 (-) Transcript_27453:1013-1753(-)